MPPKQKVTKDMLLEHAFQIAKEQGIMAVTSRSVAKAANCSIQPIFTHFPTMQELRKATFAYASNKLMQDILQYQGSPDFIIQTNIWMLNLARNESKLFELLYLSDSFDSPNLWEVMMQWECNRAMLSAVAAKYGLSQTECQDVFQRGFFMLFGIAAMLAKGKIEISNDEAIDMVQRTFSQMVGSMKG